MQTKLQEYMSKKTTSKQYGMFDCDFVILST